MLYQVVANDIELGRYEASCAEEAVALCAQDAGYRDVADMVAQLGTHTSDELVAYEA